MKLSTWDALGYYLYLPSHFIYHDDYDLRWKDSIDRRYQLSGGEFYQASKQRNGHYVFKYMKGVSHLQMPFFLVAHAITKHSSYPADGFSFYYQLAIAVAAIVYALIGLILLQRFLLHYFDDRTTGITLLLLVLSSNALQYFSVDSGMSHVYIFPLYAAILLLSKRWQEKANTWNTLGLGLVFGTAVICRPTEAVMLFIPLLWNAETMGDLKKNIISVKWKHMVLFILSIFLAILPQLLYWKESSGSWIWDVGSKWDFLSPHVRVLFGWEKGWFIYTPVALFMIAGLFFLKPFPFNRSVWVFTLLNIYIIISWHIWRYGASYSCRALVESYPVMAIPLAAFVQHAQCSFLRWPFYGLSVFLIIVNLFQIKQYNEGILHYDEMNSAYYKAIYLNPHPSPLQMSLLDYPEQPVFKENELALSTTRFGNRKSYLSGDTIFNGLSSSSFVKLNFELRYNDKSWSSFYQVSDKDHVWTFRLEKPLAKPNTWITYEVILPLSKYKPYFITLHGQTDLVCEIRNGRAIQLK